MPSNPLPDLSRACWRCQYWGGLVADAHARCTRQNSALQADPVTGCVHWAPGAGDKLLAGWAPVGFNLAKHIAIWGPPPTIDARVHHPLDDRPAGGSSDAAVWDHKWEAKAWREADALMARARRALVRPAARLSRRRASRRAPRSFRGFEC